MDIRYKLKLVDVLEIEPYNFPYIEKLNLPTETLEKLMEDDYGLLFHDLTTIIENENENEQNRLVATYFRSKLAWGILNKADKEDFYEIDNSDSDDIDDVNDSNGSFKIYENKEILKLCEKIEKIPQETINKQMFDFIRKNYPAFENGFDLTLYRLGRDSFYESLGIQGGIWWYSQSVREKLRLAEKVVQEDLQNYINNLFVNNISYWVKEYKKWSTENGTKYTKGNIKNFFTTKGKKVPSYFMDMLKANLKDESK